MEVTPTEAISSDQIGDFKHVENRFGFREAVKKLLFLGIIPKPVEPPPPPAPIGTFRNKNFGQIWE